MSLINVDILPFETLRRLQFTSHKLYLTGSRFFGYARWDSDWDFYAEIDTPLIDYLKKIGFNRLQMNPDWYDSNTHSIWIHNSKVEISLQHNIALKRKAQTYIKNTPLRDSLQKVDSYSRRDIWNQVFNDVINGESDINKES